jgi:hypothetical protein
MMLMFKEVLLVSLHKNSQMFIMMVCLSNHMTLLLVSLILVLKIEEIGINVWYQLKNHIDKNSVLNFMESMLKESLNVLNYIIIVKIVVIWKYILWKKFIIINVGEDVLENPKPQLKELWNKN